VRRGLAGGSTAIVRFHARFRRARYRRHLLWPLGLSLSLFPAFLPAQQFPCDNELERQAYGPHGYRQRGDRCEGLYQKQVGGTTLFLASLTEFFEDYDAASGQQLVVDWSAPDSGVVQLRAEGIRRKLYYRMESRRPAGSDSYRWPPDVLAALHIKRDDIGILGWTQHQLGGVQRNVYVPLRVTQTHAARTCGTTLVVLFPGVKLEEVFVSLASLGTDGQPVTWTRKDKPLGYGYYPAEKPIKVPVTEFAAPGVYYLGISAKLSNGGFTALERWIYHAGRSPTCDG